MPKGIGQRGIGNRTGIAGRQIANRYRPNRSKILSISRKNAAGSGTITSPSVPTIGEIWMIGGGGASANATPTAQAAGGAASLYKRWLAPANAAYSYNIGAAGVNTGADGGDTTFSGPGIAGTLTAGGGKGQTNGGAGGTATGGDINRSGGAGGAAGNPAGDGTSGGTGGGAGGTHNTITPGGGGAAGFGDIYPDDLIGGPGGSTNTGDGTGNAPGGGGTNGKAGADGKLIVVFTQLTIP